MRDFQKANTAILRRYGEQITAKITKDSRLKANINFTLNAEQLLDVFRANDPTTSKKYVNWILRVWLAGSFRYFEDIHKVKEPLMFFDQLKSKLPEDQRDIGRFKDFKSFDQFVDMHREMDVRSENQKERNYEANLFAKRSARLFYESENIKIVVPLTKKAAIHFGRNTKWCTAARNSDNYFKYYNERGRLYIVLFKKENKRWQFHFEDGQFMDEKDNELNYDQIITVAGAFPEKMWMETIENDLTFAEVIRNPTDKMMKYIIDLGGFKYITDYFIPRKLCLYALRNRLALAEDVLCAVENQTMQFQLSVIKLGCSFDYNLLKDPSEKVIEAYFKKFPYKISSIRNPSTLMAETAIKSNSSMIGYLNNHFYSKIIADAIIKDYRNIRYVKYPSNHLKKLAIDQSPQALAYIDYLSDHLARYAVELWGWRGVAETHDLSDSMKIQISVEYPEAKEYYFPTFMGKIKKWCKSINIFTD